MKCHSSPLEDLLPKPCIGGTCLFADCAFDHSEDVLYLLVKAKGEQITPHLQSLLQSFQGHQ